MKVIALLLASTLLIGCSSTKSSSQPPKEIQIFREGDQQPARDYREIGLLTDDGKEIEQPKIEEKMVNKARKMGGDAIIFSKPSYSGTEGQAYYMRGFAFGGAKVTYLFRGTVIGYK